ncbi:acyl-CoA thioester hydrolase/BAAT C-terminal domain-containing protein [Phenylobacterium sp.]|uniref:acyl-CoA thioester hydrolase/BAAT C-terminal domain-containing protein n=1 Tax=Phenylobacterium sp. TaxID=1871053 RepID=UPI00120AE383|nr:acyl-CoA thioester hydrolase/BAAT C-terminal domain-containing protein [Phenylobacterium sp.]THD61330.1 MAG: dienelactone hydrolase [Phenylobacterium sp.]
MKPSRLAATLMCGLLVCAASANAQPAAEPTRTTVGANGLVADLYVPAGAKGRLPAIIALGGSEGGMGAATARDSRLMAQRGYAVLQVAYFDAPGLPKDLGLIPLEYFKTAIDWLRAQPGVDPDRIGIVGGSIGSEVALTVASRYPEIKAAVATMPSNVVWPGIIHTSGDPPSTFTLGGRPLPYLPYGAGAFTTVFNLYAKGLAALDQHPDAVIPVERINGPVMLVCGRADTLWPSCPMSEQAAARLKALRFKHPVELLEYDGAGHAVYGQPYDPSNPRISTLTQYGGTIEGNQAARKDSWDRSMAFLDAALKPDAAKAR